MDDLATLAASVPEVAARNTITVVLAVLARDHAKIDHLGPTAGRRSSAG